MKNENAFLRAYEQENNHTLTENGAGALKSTLNACLDMFGTLGAVRTNGTDAAILDAFKAAFYEDPQTAMHTLFYLRDVRGGQGARRVFRVCMNWLAQWHQAYAFKNLENFLEYGRADDLMCLMGTPVEHKTIEFIKEQLRKDIEAMGRKESVSLLAKWLPSENASSKETRHMGTYVRERLGLTARRYRKILSALRAYLKVTEVKMSAREWSEINYEAVPSRAGLQYRRAFMKHDSNRYVDYLAAVARGKAKVNANALFPVDIVEQTMKYGLSEADIALLDGMWNALPDYTDKDETGICVVDTSGSMSGKPFAVAVALGLYCADKCRGPFHGKFFTFSEQPHLQSVKGDTIYEKVHNLKEINAYNTDLESVFNQILEVAVNNNLAQKDLPSKLYIISDMQFDQMRGAVASYSWRERRKPRPFMASMRERFEAAGYEMPSIVYWNVRESDCGMFQQTFEGENCAMVSGYSPSLFKAIVGGTSYTIEINAQTGKVTQHATINPMDVMYAAVYDERYDKVWVAEMDRWNVKA